MVPFSCLLPFSKRLMIEIEKDVDQYCKTVHLGSFSPTVEGMAAQYSIIIL